MEVLGKLKPNDFLHLKSLTLCFFCECGKWACLEGGGKVPYTVVSDGVTTS